MLVFDREEKQRQKDRAAASPRAANFDYLKDFVAQQLVERLDDLHDREFAVAADLGCNAGHVLKHLGLHGSVGRIINLDMSPMMLERARAAGVADAEERRRLLAEEAEYEYDDFEGEWDDEVAWDDQNGNFDEENEDGDDDWEEDEDLAPPIRGEPERAAFVVADEESLPLQPESCDLIISSMSLHWINDLPGALAQAHRALKPDGVFLAAMVGGSTLTELRTAFASAEQERDGGVSPRASPLAQVSDVGSLLVGAGFALPTVDTDTVHCRYADAATVFEHLQGSGDSNASLGRLTVAKRDTMLAAACVYQTMYAAEVEDGGDCGREDLASGDSDTCHDTSPDASPKFEPDPAATLGSAQDDGAVPATFQIVYMIGWKVSDTTPKALAPGSAQRSLKDLGFSSDAFLA
jgi:NADH dehydrogenase [ubiquinone] 1 alpha subcomplex assembly factor 5